MCCPGLCECLHLWRGARCCYECAMSEYSDFGLEPDKKWIRRYTNEEHRGFMLLQRERRLKEEENEGIALPQNDLPPKYGETPPSLERQLAEIRQQYWLHQQELTKIEAAKPRGPAIGQWEMLRRIKNLQGKSIAWEEASRKCAVLGGCCGRNCGCCDKPLKEFLMPTGIRKKESGIYGHCTVECPCCIRFRGFYKPDPASVRLPELGQDASHIPKPGENGDGLVS